MKESLILYCWFAGMFWVGYGIASYKYHRQIDMLKSELNFFRACDRFLKTEECDKLLNINESEGE